MRNLPYLFSVVKGVATLMDVDKSEFFFKEMMLINACVPVHRFINSHLFVCIFTHDPHFYITAVRCTLHVVCTWKYDIHPSCSFWIMPCFCISVL